MGLLLILTALRAAWLQVGGWQEDGGWPVDRLTADGRPGCPVLAFPLLVWAVGSSKVFGRQVGAVERPGVAMAAAGLNV
jgi:hypothetical protein